MTSSVIDSLIQAIAQDTADKILALVKDGGVEDQSDATVDDTSKEDEAAAKKAAAAEKRKKAAAAKKKAEAEAAAAEEEEDVDDGLGLDDDDDDDAPTREQVRDALKEYAGVEGKAAAIAILNDNGAKSMGELDEGNFQAVIDACTS